MRLRPLTEAAVEEALRRAFEEASPKFVRAAMRRIVGGRLEGDRIVRRLVLRCGCLFGGLF